MANSKKKTGSFSVSMKSQIERALERLGDDSGEWSVSQDPSAAHRFYIENSALPGRSIAAQLSFGDKSSPAGATFNVSTEGGRGATVVGGTLTADYLHKTNSTQFTLRTAAENLAASLNASKEIVASAAAKGRNIDWNQTWRGVLAGNEEYGIPSFPHVGAERKSHLAGPQNLKTQSQITFQIQSDAPMMPWETEYVKQTYVALTGGGLGRGDSKINAPLNLTPEFTKKHPVLARQMQLEHDAMTWDKMSEYVMAVGNQSVLQKIPTELTREIRNGKNELQGRQIELSGEPGKTNKRPSVTYGPKVIVSPFRIGRGGVPIPFQAESAENEGARYVTPNIRVGGDKHPRARQVETNLVDMSASIFSGGRVAYYNPEDVQADLWGAESTKSIDLQIANAFEFGKKGHELRLDNIRGATIAAGSQGLQIGTLEQGDPEHPYNLMLPSSPSNFVVQGSSISIPMYVNRVTGAWATKPEEGNADIISTEPLASSWSEKWGVRVERNTAATDKAFLNVRGVLDLGNFKANAFGWKYGDIPTYMEESVTVGGKRVALSGFTAEAKTDDVIASSFFGARSKRQTSGMFNEWAERSGTQGARQFADWFQNDYKKSSWDFSRLAEKYNEFAGLGKNDEGYLSGNRLASSVFSTVILGARGDEQRNAANWQNYRAAFVDQGQSVTLGLVDPTQVRAIREAERPAIMEAFAKREGRAMTDDEFSKEWERLNPVGEKVAGAPGDTRRKLLSSQALVMETSVIGAAEYAYNPRINQSLRDVLAMNFPNFTNSIGASYSSGRISKSGQLFEDIRASHAWENSAIMKNMEGERPTGVREIDRSEVAHLQSIANATNLTEREKLEQISQKMGDGTAMLHFGRGDAYLPSPRTMMNAIYSQGKEEFAGLSKEWLRAVGRLSAFESHSKETNAMAGFQMMAPFYQKGHDLLVAGGEAAKSAVGVRSRFGFAGGFLANLFQGQDQVVLGMKQAEAMVRRSGIAGENMVRRLVNQSSAMVGKMFAAVRHPQTAGTNSLSLVEGVYGKQVHGILGSLYDRYRNSSKYGSTIGASLQFAEKGFGDFDVDKLLAIGGLTYEKDEKGRLQMRHLDTSEMKNLRLSQENAHAAQAAIIPDRGFRDAANALLSDAGKGIRSMGINVLDKVIGSRQMVDVEELQQTAISMQSQKTIGMGVGYNLAESLIAGLRGFGVDKRLQEEAYNVRPASYQFSLDFHGLPQINSTGANVAKIMASVRYAKNRDGEDVIQAYGNVREIGGKRQLYAGGTDQDYGDFTGPLNFLTGLANTATGSEANNMGMKDLHLMGSKQLASLFSLPEEFEQRSAEWEQVKPGVDRASSITSYLSGLTANQLMRIPAWVAANVRASSKALNGVDIRKGTEKIPGTIDAFTGFMNNRPAEWGQQVLAGVVEFDKMRRWRTGILGSNAWMVRNATKWLGGAAGDAIRRFAVRAGIKPATDDERGVAQAQRELFTNAPELPPGAMSQQQAGKEIENVIQNTVYKPLTERVSASSLDNDPNSANGQAVLMSGLVDKALIANKKGVKENAEASRGLQIHEQVEAYVNGPESMMKKDKGAWNQARVDRWHETHPEWEEWKKTHGDWTAEHWTTLSQGGVVMNPRLDVVTPTSIIDVKPNSAHPETDHMMQLEAQRRAEGGNKNTFIATYDKMDKDSPEEVARKLVKKMDQPNNAGLIETVRPTEQEFDTRVRTINAFNQAQEYIGRAHHIAQNLPKEWNTMGWGQRLDYIGNQMALPLPKPGTSPTPAGATDPIQANLQEQSALFEKLGSTQKETDGKMSPGAETAAAEALPGQQPAEAAASQTKRKRGRPSKKDQIPSRNPEPIPAPVNAAAAAAGGGGTAGGGGDDGGGGGGGDTGGTGGGDTGGTGGGDNSGAGKPDGQPEPPPNARRAGASGGGRRMSRWQLDRKILALHANIGPMVQDAQTIQTTIEQAIGEIDPGIMAEQIPFQQKLAKAMDIYPSYLTNRIGKADVGRLKEIDKFSVGIDQALGQVADLGSRYNSDSPQYQELREAQNKTSIAGQAGATFTEAGKDREMIFVSPEKLKRLNELYKEQDEILTRLNSTSDKTVREKVKEERDKKQREIELEYTAAELEPLDEKIKALRTKTQNAPGGVENAADFSALSKAERQQSKLRAQFDEEESIVEAGKKAPMGKTGAFLRHTLGGFGLMYLKSMTNLVTEGLGYGMQERTQYEATMAQQGNALFGSRMTPFNQTQQLANSKAMNGTNWDPRIAAQVAMAKNPGARLASDVGLAGLSGYATTAWLLSNAGVTTETLAAAGSAWTTPGIGLAVAGVAAVGAGALELYSNAQDPMQLGRNNARARQDMMRQDTYMGSGSAIRGPVRAFNWMAGELSFAMQSKEQQHETVKSELATDLTREGFKANKTPSQIVDDLFYGGAINSKAEAIIPFANELGARYDSWASEEATVGGAAWMLRPYQKSFSMAQQENVVRDFQTLKSTAFASQELQALGYSGEQYSYNLTQLGNAYIEQSGFTEGEMQKKLTGAQIIGKLSSKDYIRGVGAQAGPIDKNAVDLAESYYSNLTTNSAALNAAQLDAQAYSNMASTGWVTGDYKPQTSTITPSMTQEQAGKVAAEKTAWNNAWQQQSSIAQGYQAKAYTQGLYAEGNRARDFMMDPNRARVTDSYYNRMFVDRDPLMFGAITMGGNNGFDLGALSLRTLNGTSVSADLMAWTDKDMKGNLTGLDWGQSSLRLSGMTGAETAQQIFGKWSRPNQAIGRGGDDGKGGPLMGTQTQDYRTNDKLDQPLINAMVNGYTDASGNTYGGAIGAKLFQNQRQYEHTLQQFSWQNQGRKLEYANTMANWGFEDRGIAINIRQQQASFGFQQRGMDLSNAQQAFSFDMQKRQYAHQDEQQNWNFGFQQRQLDLSNKQWGENFALTQKGVQQQRGWAQQDWGLNQARFDLNWQWKQQDFAEESRFMTGRQRRLAERQMGRDTISHGLDQDQMNRGITREKQSWKLEDERYALEKKQHTESLKMQQEQLNKNREFYKEDIKLRDEQLAKNIEFWQLQKQLQQEQLNSSIGFFAEETQLRAEQLNQNRQYWKDQWDLAQQQIDKTQEWAAEAKRNADTWDILGNRISTTTGAAKTILEESFTIFADALIQSGPALTVLIDQLARLPGVVLQTPKKPGNATGGSFLVPNSVGFEGFDLGGIATAGPGERITITPVGQEAALSNYARALMPNDKPNLETNYISMSNQSRGDSTKIINIDIGQTRFATLVLDTITGEVQRG